MSDGLVERLNRTIQQMLMSYVNENRSDWENHLPYILMAYRSSMQESTGCTPNLLMLGREVSIPVDLLLGQPPHAPPSQCAIDYVEWMRAAMERAFEFARAKMKTSVVRQKRNYNKKVNQEKISRGDWVWLANPPLGKVKLGKGWVGPYLVIQPLSEVTFKIQKSVTAKPKVVHANNIKPYLSDTTPACWLRLSAPLHNNSSTQTTNSTQSQATQTNCQPGTRGRQSSRARQEPRRYSPS